MPIKVFKTNDNTNDCFSLYQRDLKKKEINQNNQNKKLTCQSMQHKCCAETSGRHYTLWANTSGQ